MSTGLLESTVMPGRIRSLPRGPRGYPIPWFVGTGPGGQPDVRVQDPGSFRRALAESLCWVCGQRLPKRVAFVLGPVRAINRVTADPPSHEECVEYSVKVCPFLAAAPGQPAAAGGPAWERSDVGAGGSVVWVTGLAGVSLFRPAGARESQRLVEFGNPVRVTWWREGRPATRAQAEELLLGGLATLQELCEAKKDPQAALRDLRRRYRIAAAFLPAEGTAS